MKLIRLQGKEWHNIKNKLRYIKTLETTDKGHIKCLFTDGKKEYSHWLNDEEIKKLEESK